jgi:hypothetical protein
VIVVRKKNFTEKQNDALLFWETLGPHIYRIIGIIVIGGLIAAGLSLKGAIDRHNERVAIEQQQEITAQRQEIVDKYINNNPKTFGTVTKQWNNGNLFFAESEFGEFTIAFEGLAISKVFVENKAGQMVVLYEK